MQATIQELVNMCYFLNGENGKENKNTKVPEGWEIVDKLIDDKTGFMGYALKKGQNIVVCYKGTDCKSSADFASDIAFFFGKTPAQYPKAKQLYLNVKEKYGKDHEIVVSASSLGGGLAEILGTDVCKDKIITFNPVGTHRVIKNNSNIKDTTHIFNIVVKTDVVGNLFPHSGNVLYVDGPSPIIAATTLSKGLTVSAKTPVKKVGLKSRLLDSHLVGNFKNFVSPSVLNTPIDDVSKLFNIKRLDIIDKSLYELKTFNQPNVLQKKQVMNPLVQIYKSSLSGMKI